MTADGHLNVAIGVGSEAVRLEGIKEELAESRAVIRARRKRQRIEEMCDQYLSSLHCTLWGQPFEIISPKGRAQAVAWLADTLEGLAAVKEASAGDA